MAHIWLLAVLFLATTSGSEANRKINKKCEKIAVPQCENLGYHHTKFPNPLTNISTQEETNNQTKFLPLLAQLNCTRINAMPFLCAVYVPICTVRRPVIPPCREFCEKSVGDCPKLAAEYGIIWPTPLECSRYPAKHSGEKCISKLRTRSVKGKKDKKKPKADGTKCCRFGEISATKGNACNLTETMATTHKRRFLKGLAICKNFESKFTECCKKQEEKIAKRTKKKLEKKAKKEERKIKKQEKAMKRLQKKQENKKKRKQERKQKKQERKGKKGNRKEKKNGKSG